MRDRLAGIGPEAVGISIATLAELRYGAACSSRPEANQRAIDDFAGGMIILGFDPPAAQVFAYIKAELRREGMLIEDFDLIIAATARVNDLTLATNNTKHFRRISDLRFESWI